MSSVLPLKGIRVLDMTRILAGPFCTMLLGDLGAEIIKVEHTKGGDDTRTWGPPFSSAGHESAYFLGVNRNKKSIAVNMKAPEGQQIIHDLAKVSDIVVENFVPGKTSELRCDYGTLSTINPKLVYASLSGYGSDGPRSTELAYDVMVSAVGGLLGITGTSSGEYCKVGVAITDICAGLVMQGAILAAYIHVLRTGQGQWLETSLLATQIAALANVASAYLVAGVVTKPQGTAHVSIVPYQAFQCKDRGVVVGALNDGQFQRLCDALNLSNMKMDPRFATNASRVAHRRELIPVLEKVLAERDSTDLLDTLTQNDVPCAPINRLDQVFEDKQVKHCNRVVTVEHPTVGLLKLVANPVTYHGTPLTRYQPPPVHGQHTESVLSGLLGLSDAQIKNLIAQKVIHQNKDCR
jgi:crotonobetainyl-CoA:carnitine CoA-transferase CaiB-like acyl-CoA transferase